MGRFRGLRIAPAVVALVLAAGLAGAVPAGADGHALILDDLTGDGIVDRITLGSINPDMCTLTTAAGDGSGGFGAPTTMLFGPDPCPTMGTVIDLAGDGTRELILTWSSWPNSSRNLAALSPGGGATRIATGLTSPDWIGSDADFDGDGLEDVWESSVRQGLVRTYLNTAHDGPLSEGPARFCDQRSAQQFEFADFDLDGATDIVASYQCSTTQGAMVILGRTGRQLPLITGSGSYRAVRADLNGDNRPDVIVTRDGVDIHFLNEGNGGFTRPDSGGPTVTVTTPAQGATVGGNAVVTVSGTASETVGGGPATRVEVSEDGGATWRPATGTDEWTYAWLPARPGPASLRVRAIDDGLDVGATVVLGVVVGAAVCPCTVFGPSVPRSNSSSDRASVEVGMKFTASQNVLATGARFYKLPTNVGPHVASLWTATGQRLATGTFTGETASGWQTLSFATPVGLRADTTYVVSYTAFQGQYAADSGYFATGGAGQSPLTALPGTTPGGNGVFRFGAGFPTSTFNSTNYWVDVTVTTDGVDTTAPTVLTTTPSADTAGVFTDAEIAATFSEDVDPTSVRFEVSTGGGQPLLGAIVTEGARSVFVPEELLAANSVHTVTLRATDPIGNPLTPAHTWSFTTGGAAGCPCTILGSRRPARADADDGGNVELGVKFSTSVRTMATGVRFYKSAANTGTHTGSLWTSAGALLATGTFTGETDTGWQTLTFGQSVPLTPGVTYVASYRAPNGHYAADLDYFATAGAGRAPLIAPASPAAGGNGVFRYGGGFPSESYRSANYWVDVVVDTAGLDNTPPVVASRTPAADTIGAAPDGGVVVGFDERVEATSVSVTVHGPGGAVSGSSRVADDLRGVSFAPDVPLAGDTTYTAAVQAVDLAGNAMPDPATWTFTTGAGPCPCSLFTVAQAPAGTGTDTPVELGMRWRSDVDGFVTGVRFYKTLGDTGTHTGSLWTAGGTRLATGIFTGESAAGWQTLLFDTPVAVTAGTTYAVSYHSAAGRYGYTLGDLATGHRRGPLSAPADPNGLYRYGSGGVFPDGDGGGRNYWVDAVVTR